MSLFAQTGVITAETVNGNDTTISGLTTPKLILFATTKDTAAGATDTHMEFYFGAATYDGGAVQQWYLSCAEEDAAGTSNTAKGFNTTACLKGYSAFTTPTVEFELRLVSMDSTSITLDWFDAPASAIKVHYLVLGGSDLAKARCFNFTGSVAAATQDVTVNTGFGLTDFLILASHSTTAFGDSAGARFSIGFAKSLTERFAAGVWSADGQTTEVCSQFQKAVAGASFASVTGFDGELDFDKANNPTDGVRINYPNQLAAAHLFCGVALQGTFQSAIGTNTAPTSGATPVVQDNAAGFAPKAAVTCGRGMVTGTNVDSTNADIISFFLGFMDGTNEGLSAITQDDGNGTSFAGRVHSETKAAAFYTSPGAAGAPTLQSEADGSFSGNNVRLSWSDIDSIAREYKWVAFGDAASSGQNVNMTGLGSAASFGTLSITPGNANVSMTGLGSAAAFGTVTITTGNVDVPMTGLGSAASFGIVDARLNTNVAMTGLGSAAEFGTVTYTTGNVNVNVPGLGSAAEFGEVIASQSANLWRRRMIQGLGL